MSLHPEGKGATSPGGTPGRAGLVIVDGSGSQSRADLDPRRRYSIGRHRGNDIVLAHPSLSRRHAEVWFEGGDWLVADCGSSNGTLRDGVAIVKPVTLGPGVWLTMGPYTISLGAPEPRKRITFTDQPVSSGGTLVLSSDDAALEALRSSDHPLAEEIQPELEAIRLRFAVIEKANLELLAHEPMETLLPKVLDLVFEALHVDRSALLRLEPDGELSIAAFKGGDTAEFTLSRAIAAKVIQERASILTADAQQDSRFALQQSILHQGIRSVMAVPLGSGSDGEVTGILYADSLLSTKVFDDADLRILTMLGNIAAIQIRNAILFEDQVEKRRLEKEADAAASIQRRLLPSEFPSIPGYRFAAGSTPCTEVGGDTFDCLPMREGRTAIVVGDVAGKGMGAALLMAALQATLHARVDQGCDPAALLGHLGRTVERDAPANRFVTLVLAILDPGSHRAVCVNAGHAPAPLLVRRTGALEPLPPGGPPLGIVPDFEFIPAEIRLDPGDILFCCSDGVTELAGAGGEMFGDERLEAFLREAAGRDPEEIRRGLLTRLESFAEGTERTDDLTIVVLRRDP